MVRGRATSGYFRRCSSPGRGLYAPQFARGPGTKNGTALARSLAGMTEDAKQLRDEDLARWAKELGVSYEELASTLNYAGPTFKDLTFSSDARRAGSTSMPS